MIVVRRFGLRTQVVFARSPQDAAEFVRVMCEWRKVHGWRVPGG
jgi:hypothetical protein